MYQLWSEKRLTLLIAPSQCWHHQIKICHKCLNCLLRVDTHNTRQVYEKVISMWDDLYIKAGRRMLSNVMTRASPIGVCKMCTVWNLYTTFTQFADDDQQFVISFTLSKRLRVIGHGVTAPVSSKKHNRNGWCRRRRPYSAGASSQAIPDRNRRWDG